MAIARNTQVQGIADIRTELKRVIAANFADVVHKLELAFQLRQRAIAVRVVPESISDASLWTCWVLDVEPRQTGGVRRVQIQSWNASGCSRRSAESVGNIVDVIPHVAEAEFVDQTGIGSMCPARRNALVSGVRTAGIVCVAKCLAAGCIAENAGRLLCELSIAVTAENGVLLVNVIIPASIPLIAIDSQVAAIFVVVVGCDKAVHYGAGRVWQWEVLQQVLRLLA